MHKLKNILKDYTYLASASVFSSLLRMVALFVITIYLLEPAAFGIYSLLLVIGGMMGFGVSWFYPSLVRFGREDLEKKKKMNTTFWSGLLMIVVFALVVSLLFLLIREKLGAMLSLDLSPSITLTLLFYFLLFTLFSFLLVTLQTELKFQYFSLMQASVNILFALFLFIFWIIGIAFTPFSLLFLFSLSYLVTLVMGARKIEPSILASPTIKKYRIKEMVGYSWPHIFGYLGALVFFHADKLFLKHYHSDALVGIYALAITFFWSLLMFPELLTSITFPLLTSFRFQKNTRYIDYYITRTLSHLMILTSMLASVLAFLGLILIPFFYTNDYALAAIPFAVLMVGIIFASLRRFLSPLFGAFDLIKQTTGVVCASAPIGLLLLYLLVPRYGLLGTSIAMTLLMMVEVLIAFTYLHVKIGMNTLKPLLLGLPAVFLIAGLLVISSLLARLLVLCIGLGVYIFITWFFRLFDERDLNILGHLSMPKRVKESLLKIGNYFLRTP